MHCVRSHHADGHCFGRRGGVASVQFVIDLGYSDQENAERRSPGSYTTTFNFATLSAAWYDVSAVATDTAGNTATATIEVDDTINAEITQPFCPSYRREARADR